MNNTSETPTLPAGMSSGFLKTVAIAALLVLVVTRWNDFISIFANVLLWIYDLLGNGPHMFGVAIILFTILIRIVTWPLNPSQMKGAAAMQEMNNDKDWQAIQKKYAKDREKLAQEQMRIYREKGSRADSARWFALSSPAGACPARFGTSFRKWKRT